MDRLFSNQFLHSLRTTARESNIVNYYRLARDHRTHFDELLISQGRTPEYSMRKFKHLIPAEGVQRDELIRVARQYKYDFDEYFLFRLWEKTEKEISEIIPDHQHNYYHVKLNSAFTASIFNDKYKTYVKYKPYYKRNVIRIKGGGIQDHFNEIYDFANRQTDKKAIVKVIYGGCGWGVKLLDLSTGQRKETLEKDFLVFYKGYQLPFVCEEVIRQASITAELHPQSVNTVRITTIRTNNDVKIIHPFFRIGRGDSIVDNGGAGGIFCGLTADGKVDATIDELGYRYTTHPETGKQLIGFQLPEWKKAVDLAKELTMVVPQNRYTGWDLTYTDNGWVLVEANMDGQFIGWQTLYQKGFKPELDEILKEIYGKTIQL